MQKNTPTDHRKEKRFDFRTALDRYYSVEFKLKQTGSLYHFKLRDLSSKGLGILVNEDSAVLKHLAVNDILNMKYYQPDASTSAEFLKTKIIHITKKERGSFKGHFLIGLLIIERYDHDNNTQI